MRDPRPSESAVDLALTQPLRPVILAGGLSLGLFAFSAAFAFVVLSPIVPRERLAPPAVVGSVFVLVWTVLLTVMAVRRPTHEERVRVWGPVSQGIVVISHALCLWLIWGVMTFIPAAHADAQFVLAGFLIAYVPTQIICSPENTFLIRVGVVGVLGSTVVFLATRGGEYAALLAVYLAGFACVMFFLSGVVRRTVQTTVAGRLASDAAAGRLEQLLASVAEERDAKTHFISAASHDLGQPLQAASLFFDQTLRARDETARAKAAEGVRRAFASADQLLSHMLNHLRLEADAVEPFPSRIVLSVFLEQVADQYAAAAAEAGLTIRWVRTRQVLLLDPVLLGRAVGNLVANAILHSGGTRVLMGVRRHGPSSVRLWVIDDGAGVSRIDARHIFDDYFRGAATRRAVKSGFGLGLSSVRRIVALMGGECGLDRRWVRGAAFYLQFPAPAAPPARRVSPVRALAEASSR